jgi:DNA polymerase III epsilon subunit-like protein
MRFAKKLYKDNVDISEFNLTFLRYALDLPIPDHIRAHLAHEDAMVTALLFIRLVDDAVHAGIIDPAAGDVGGQIVSWLDQPIIIETMQFGKHKGKKLTEVPLDYWQWAMDNMNSLNEEHPGFDADFAASVTIAIEEILENQGA